MNREYGRKPYISKSYPEMMKRVTNKAAWELQVEKHSEFEKPYRGDDYSAMQHYHPTNHPEGIDYPGMPVGGIPVKTPSEIVFYCGGELCYCEGTTQCTTLYPTHPIVGIDTAFCDPCIEFTLSGNQLCVTVPEGCNVNGICSYDVLMLATYSGGSSPGGRFGIVTKLVNPVQGSHGNKQLRECDDCCGCTGISIGYTTQGMSVDEVQTLTATGAADGCTYNWAIASGGGELSAATGTSVDYTAPSTNAECANNPTITLTVEGDVCDSLDISINAYSYGGCDTRDRAWAHNCVSDNYYGNYYCCLWYTKCDGTYYDYACSGGVWAYCASCNSDTPNSYSIITSVHGTQQLAIDDCAAAAKNGDIRDSAQITAGCCPPQAL